MVTSEVKCSEYKTEWLLGWEKGSAYMQIRLGTG